ncbi:uncharacterized protein LOC121384742 isoform X2 [Gigantopelta aegis]|uniref:uncharacterized protein LOC121384742 isoform X2 n=1 Tax=Gigantopelta aegis TaxID=1735272 RepID=UPI001B88C9A8|nr:uncharacterized protein LOC121384742 isoform X2 [Gigantopelta aegis]
MWLYARKIRRSWKTMKRNPVLCGVLTACIVLFCISVHQSLGPEPVHFEKCRMASDSPWLVENTTNLGMNISELTECDVSMTVVTAFFDIGTFQKGPHGNFSFSLYHDWAASFQYLRNPLVVYTDSVPFRNRIAHLRYQLKESTKIIFIKTKSLWSWNMIDEMKELFSKPWYPKYHPNTVIPEYAAAQHAKYAVVSDAITRNFFQTEFYSWVDVGYFRDLSNKKPFVLVPPRGFRRNRVGANVVGHKPARDPNIKDIFYKNLFWVGGGMFFGVADVLLNFTRQYETAVRMLMNMKLAGTDQQVLYSMFSKEGRRLLKPKIELHLFYPKDEMNGHTNDWFYLGYYCLREVHFVPSAKLLQSQWDLSENTTES